MTTIGLTHDCPRCGTRHLTSCCHASRHNLCDACVHEQHEQRARALRTRPGLPANDPTTPGSEGT